MATKAKRIEYAEVGGPEVLYLTDIEVPDPSEGNVLVEIKAAGVNPIDWKIRSGFRSRRGLPDLPNGVGFDGAGVIVDAGSSTKFKQGDRVAITESSGTYATHLLVKEAKAHLLPDNVSYGFGAGLGVPAGTAYQVLKSLNIGPDDVVLIHGASGAVGQCAIQFAKHFGAEVIGTASAKNLDRITALGALALEYGPELKARIEALTDKKITAIYDFFGAPGVFDESYEILPDKSRIGTIVNGALAVEQGFAAWSGGSPIPLTPEENAWRAEAPDIAIALGAKGEFEVEIGLELPLSSAVEAHRLIESGGIRGKIVLVP